MSSQYNNTTQIELVRIRAGAGVIVTFVVQPPHLVPLGVFVVPDNDWSSRQFAASLNIEDELHVVQV